MRHLHRSELHRLVEHAARAGRAALVVHAAPTMAQTLVRFGEDLRFPEYYGHNLDALVDCLRDLADDRRRAITLILTDVEPLRAHSPAEYAELVQLLDDVEGERDDLAVVVLDR